mmetsp:Transcript_30506/g.62201  ORF Transcript_30506/g.62201 Transcript_30506/m.62201 type:complete len:96 (-) Transcript_30506:363-650(-)
MSIQYGKMHIKGINCSLQNKGGGGIGNSTKNWQEPLGLPTEALVILMWQKKQRDNLKIPTISFSAMASATDQNWYRPQGRRNHGGDAGTANRPKT